MVNIFTGSSLWILLSIFIFLLAVVFIVIYKKRKAKMAAGMQIFDETGKTVFDSNDPRMYAYMVETFRVHVPAGVGYTRGTRTSPKTLELVGRGATPFLFSSSESQRESRYGRFYAQVEFVPGTYTIRWNAFRLSQSYHFDVYIGVYA